MLQRPALALRGRVCAATSLQQHAARRAAALRQTPAARVVAAPPRGDPLYQQPLDRRCYAAPSNRDQPTTTSSSTTGSTSSADLDALTPDERRPIVVLAGWLGAPERPFLKYVDLWRGRLGAAAVLQARPNPAALIVPAFGAASASRAADRLLAAADRAPDAPLLLHLFSGGGFLYSGLLLRALQRKRALASLAPRIAGVVLDSSPAFVTADVSARALLAAALREPAAGVEDRHPRALGALRGAVDAYLSLPPTRNRIRDMEYAWHELTPPCPKLYLYSESDVLVSPDTIQSHMSAEAVRGSRVYAHRWVDTPHVEHYRLHPEQYTSIVARFCDEALAMAAAGQRGGGSSSSSSSDGSDTFGSSVSGELSGSGRFTSSSSSSSGGGGGDGRSMWQRQV
jgi:hypothetical protein